MIDLWTVQPLIVWEKLTKLKVLAVDPGLMTVDDLPDNIIDPHPLGPGSTAYDWIVSQMKERIHTPPNVTYPWWAWHIFDGRTAEPNLKHLNKVSWYRRLYTKTQPMVCVHLRLPQKEVLTFDDNGWYAVLNCSYLALNEDDFEQYEDKAKQSGLKPWDEIKHEPFRSQIINSWQRIFGPKLFDPDWHGKPEDDSTQATFWLLRLTDVVGCKYFRGRVEF